jgi:sugar phosphate isomerase/epimerase
MAVITFDQLVSSPACQPQLTLEQILPLYAEMGFHKFELFSTWCKSAADIHSDPKPYVELGKRYSMTFTSFHLPPITNDFDTSLKNAIQGARFAQAVGATEMLYKGDSRENYIRGAKPFLDALDQEKITVTPVLQNHKGTPITTLEDFRAVIEGINDNRMKTLLEVGHFRRVDTHWSKGYELLKDSMALVHINDIAPNYDSVPFGTGDSDLPGLFSHLASIGYKGNIVVELELKDRETNPERTIQCLKDGLKYFREVCGVK